MKINEIKNQLYDEYKQYIKNDETKDKIVDILIVEGKKTLGDQVVGGTLSFGSFIYTDNYFLTTFDLWLLVNRFKIPTIFICQKFILQTKYQNHEFVGYGNLDDKFAFVVLPGFRPENVPNFRIIKSNKGDVFIFNATKCLHSASIPESGKFRDVIQFELYNKMKATNLKDFFSNEQDFEVNNM